jgi:sugar lactone lactonase YvrE
VVHVTDGGQDGTEHHEDRPFPTDDGAMQTLDIPGLKFPEGPRWRDGTWWLSDQLGHRILRVDEAGGHETVCEAESPSGLGFDQDGALLATRMTTPSIVRVVDGAAAETVDLRGVARFLNDMCVGPDGRAYLDAYDGHFDQATHRLLLVEPGAEPRTVADGLAYPNGVAVTPDGGTLIVSETFGGRLTAFAVAADGSLGDRRVWAGLPDGTNPDGLCLDANGDVWVASYLSGEFLHVRAGGEILDRLAVPGRWALACCLGGDDQRSLLLCTAETTQEDYFAGRSVGHLEVHRVEVPGVQRP